MSSASSSAKATTTTAKGAKKSKVVTLRLSPDKLAPFASTPAASTEEPEPEPSPPAQQADSNEKSSESNATPAPAAEDGDATPVPSVKGDNRKKRGGAAVSGRKRAPPSIDPNAPPRERGRPGPKKKPRLPDGTIDRSVDPSGKPTLPAHKLGPKANTGAINAGLRALDRSGKPCRRWQRKGVQLKSFTGTMWGMSSWGAPARASESFSGDVQSDTTNSSEAAKPNNESSVVASERSQAGGDAGDAGDAGDTLMTNGVESSPAPAVAAAS